MTPFDMGRRRGKYNSRSEAAMVKYSNTGYGSTGAYRGPPRIRASNSAVGHESAGRPNFTCIALTAVRLAWPSTPST